MKRKMTKKATRARIHAAHRRNLKKLEALKDWKAPHENTGIPSASGWIDEKGKVHSFAASTEPTSIKLEIDTGNAEEKIAALGKSLDEVRAKAQEVGVSEVRTISSALNDLDLALDALEGRLQRILRTEPETANPTLGYSDVARSVHYATERVRELTSRIDL